MSQFLKVIITLLIVCHAAKTGNIFSSAAATATATQLESLLEIESYLVDNAINSMLELENYIEEMYKFLHEVDEFAREAKKNADKLVDNPLAIFRLLKRLVVDWNVTWAYGGFEAETSNQSSWSLPNSQDLEAAVQSVLRLQSIYLLSTPDLADGILLGTKYGPSLTASECFQMGRSLYALHEMDYAIEWFNEALKRQPLELENSQAEDVPFTRYVTTEEILEYLAAAYFYAGNKKMALKMNEELLVLDAENASALQNKPFYNGTIYDLTVGNVTSTTTTTTTATNKRKSWVYELYRKVCRQELLQTPEEVRNLRCRYVSNNVPFCLLAPFKLEELNLDPFVAFYHEVISDNEIESILKTAAEGSLKPSRIGIGVDAVDVSIRSSRHTWLPYKNASLSQRLMDITGLSLRSSEPLQVVHYGVGEHYGPHYDFSETPGYNFEGSGNRILTALFYLNDVELGGATAFPFLRLAVAPIRRSMLVWPNLHESLELDYRTKHAGCPVVKGSKWICTEWFHEIDQEFLKPCSLRQNGYKSLKYKDFI